eukprot:scaffold19114_cov118-Isochrysis_galbana.AAC.15
MPVPSAQPPSPSHTPSHLSEQVPYLARLAPDGLRKDHREQVLIVRAQRPPNGGRMSAGGAGGVQVVLGQDQRVPGRVCGWGEGGARQRGAQGEGTQRLSPEREKRVRRQSVRGARRAAGLGQRRQPDAPSTPNSPAQRLPRPARGWCGWLGHGRALRTRAAR